MFAIGLIFKKMKLYIQRLNIFLIACFLLLGVQIFNPCSAQTVLYGMTLYGGTYGNGTIYSFNPDSNKEKVVWSLGGGTDGNGPNANLVYDTLNRLFLWNNILGRNE